MTSLDTTSLTHASAEELAQFRAQAQSAYDELARQDLSLNLTRGKPSTAQLDLSNRLLQLPTSPYDPNGVDTRNYGGLEGLASIRSIFAELLGVTADQLIAGDSSSLVMMRQVLSNLMRHGASNGKRGWDQEERVAFLCPVPGYDRHFTLLDWFGIDMIPVPLLEDGPDMEVVTSLVAADASIKGMWLVPTYSNPTGGVCSPAVAEQLANMTTAAPDFKILWDNAYALHHLTDVETASADLIGACEAAGHPHRALMFSSTSKITFAGAGVGFFAASTANIAWYVHHLGKGSIGPNKVNQLAHVEFFGDAAGVRAHMRQHRALLEPKFAAVARILNEQLAGLGIASWTDPHGGYFVSLDVLDGTAARVVELAGNLGVALTPAGASFPHGDDPADRNIRLAPSFPELPEVEAAMAAVAVCVKLAAAEKLTA